MTAVRRAVQILVFTAFAAIIWMTRYPLTVQLNPAMLFKADPLIMVVTSIAERVLLPGLIIAALTLLLTLIFGRVFCGWLCPLGALNDATAFIARKAAKLFHARPTDHPLPSAIFVKYIVLACIGALAVAGIQFVWLFDPITICVRSLSFSVIPLANHIFDSLGAALIQATNYYPPIDNMYHVLKEALFDPRRPIYPHAPVIGIIFGLILLMTFFVRRLWCRYLCPLGGMLAVVAKFSFLKRRSPVCAGPCRICKDVCRMGAINDDNSYKPSECIVCMDCVRYCPSQKTSFKFSELLPVIAAPIVEASSPATGMSRSQFMGWVSASLVLLLPSAAQAMFKYRKRKVLRPPAALPEAEFVQRCVRCGNCMKVCVTNCLQPVLLESGLDGIWTPKIDAAIGYCEYGCTLCGHVCPTGAIPPLSVEQKSRTKMGLAQILQDTCIPWSRGEDCLVCEEHCPTSRKAIQTSKIVVNGRQVLVPSIDANSCVGCALCENVCPASPKGVVVEPLA